MRLDDLQPLPPLWAIEAGLPEPHDDESFADYVKRIGLDPDELLVELTDTTAVLANPRLESALAKQLPDAWDKYLRQRCAGAQPTPTLASVLLSKTRFSRPTETV